MTWVDLVGLGCAVWFRLCSPSCAGWCARCSASAPGSAPIVAARLGAATATPAGRRHGSRRRRPGSIRSAFAVVFVITLIVLVLIARGDRRAWCAPRRSAGSTGRWVWYLAWSGVRRWSIIAYIVARMVVPVVRWPEPVLQSESVWPVYHGARWVVDRLPPEIRPGEVQCRRRAGRDTRSGRSLLRASAARPCSQALNVCADRGAVCGHGR